MTTCTQLEKRIARNNQRIAKLEIKTRDYAIREELTGEWVEARIEESNRLLNKLIQDYWWQKSTGHLTYKTVRCALSALVFQKICETETHYGPEVFMGVMSNEPRFTHLVITKTDTRDNKRFPKN